MADTQTQVPLNACGMCKGTRQIVLRGAPGSRPIFAPCIECNPSGDAASVPRSPAAAGTAAQPVGETKTGIQVMVDRDEYDRRAKWDVVQQAVALRGLLIRNGVDPALADPIDWIYRPALEEQEWLLNHAAAPPSPGERTITLAELQAWQDRAEWAEDALRVVRARIAAGEWRDTWLLTHPEHPTLTEWIDSLLARTTGERTQEGPA